VRALVCAYLCGCSLSVFWRFVELSRFAVASAGWCFLFAGGLVVVLVCTGWYTGLSWFARHVAYVLVWCSCAGRAYVVALVLLCTGGVCQYCCCVRLYGVVGCWERGCCCGCSWWPWGWRWYECVCEGWRCCCGVWVVGSTWCLPPIFQWENRQWLPRVHVPRAKSLQGGFVCGLGGLKVVCGLGGSGGKGGVWLCAYLQLSPRAHLPCWNFLHASRVCVGKRFVGVGVWGRGCVWVVPNCEGAGAAM
jgi:hypothetical protein